MSVRQRLSENPDIFVFDANGNIAIPNALLVNKNGSFQYLKPSRVDKHFTTGVGVLSHNFPELVDGLAFLNRGSNDITLTIGSETIVVPAGLGIEVILDTPFQNLMIDALDTDNYQFNGVIV